MLNLNRAAILILSAVLATGASAAGAATYGDKAADYGYTTPASAVERSIVLAPGAKYLNVANGETVKITIDGKSFNWHFHTYSNVNAFDLAKIAPQDVAAAGIKVYISPNPLYVGN